MWSVEAVAVLAVLATMPDRGQSQVAGPARPQVRSVAGNVSESVSTAQVRLQNILGIDLVGDMYVSVPVISPLLVTQADGSRSGPRPSFSLVYSLFEAGQKGASPLQRGVWFRHSTVTLVLSYHHGCPVQLYRIQDGQLSSELLGSPLENAEFRPALVLWAGHLMTVESLCSDRPTLVSYVSITAWDLAGKENWEPAQVVAEYPQHAELVHRLASAEFSAGQSHATRQGDTADRLHLSAASQTTNNQ